MNLVRTFIAAELPVELLLTLKKLQRSLRDAPGGMAVNWVQPEGIHLTFKFLGDVHQDVLPQIYGAMEQVCARLNTCVVQVIRLGCFPNITRPRVVWVGLQDERQELQRIQHMLENELASHNFAREDRAFQAHLTLGRVRNNALSPEVEILGRTIAGYENAVLGQINVDRLYAISSTLTPTGAVYRVLYSSPLAHQQPPIDDAKGDTSQPSPPV
jgi:RNA 2',3'-cyclic 3'-phosphodiesterase